MSILEWYRVNPLPRIARVLFGAALTLLIGCLCVAFAWLATHRDTSLRIGVGIVGATLNVGGPLSAILGLRRMLEVDHYVALRTDGVELQLERAPTRLLAWDDIEEVMCEDGVATIAMRSGERVQIEAQLHGVAPRELARRMEHTRRKIALGL